MANTLNTSTKEEIDLTIKSLAIVEFLNKFNNLESRIKKLFVENISSCSIEAINELYFFYGGRLVSSSNIDTSEIKYNTVKFKINEDFHEFTANQMMRFIKKYRFISCLKENIDSIQKERVSFNIVDSIMKIIKMRNIIAHEINNFTFKEDSIIESLSQQKIVDYSSSLLQKYLTLELDSTLQSLLSNIIYLDCILEKIKDS